MIANPKCLEARGCGPYVRPMKKNPDYKGMWKAPMIENPEYKGEWKAKQIPNMNFFEDKNPADFEKIVKLVIFNFRVRLDLKSGPCKETSCLITYMLANLWKKLRNWLMRLLN